jgi:hypothetical protein
MIDFTTEKVIPLKGVADILPSSRRGKKLSWPTLWRWVTKGVRGRKLEAVRVGGSLYTSREAVERFSRIEIVADKSRAQKTALRSAARRKREHARAKAELKAAGLR